jgi:hypothetical protein
MLWVCQQDSVRYAVGMPACPQCGSTDYREEGDEPIVDAASVDEAGPEPASVAADVEIVAPRGRGAK